MEFQDESGEKREKKHESNVNLETEFQDAGKVHQEVHSRETSVMHIERLVIVKSELINDVRICVCCLLMTIMYTDCSFVHQTNLHNHCLHHRSSLLRYSDRCSDTGTDLIGTGDPLDTNIRQTRICT